MEASGKTNITVKVLVNASVDKVWLFWITPGHIQHWNNASPDWHTPHAENDLRAGGKFLSRMEAKDGSFGFDFWGVYDEVVANQRIVYTLGDGRKATVTFTAHGSETHVIETFEAENENPADMQKFGWQAILHNFKKYVEEN